MGSYSISSTPPLMLQDGGAKDGAKQEEGNAGVASVFHPPREGGSAWPYHMDNSVLGEVYAKAYEVDGAAAWEELLSGSAAKALLIVDGAYSRFVALRNFDAAHPGFKSKFKEDASLEGVEDDDGSSDAKKEDPTEGGRGGAEEEEKEGKSQAESKEE